ncbi:MAG TPA: hypothetical protein VGG10_14450 [Rhizomicrobium sp.]|jgi:hypothetical protein
MTTTVKWNVDADGDWGTASNWSSGTLPNSNNAVLINTTDVHTVTYSGGTTTVASLAVGTRDHFVLSGGSLNVLGAASFADGFTQSGGQFQAGSASITGPGTLIGGSSAGNTAFTISGQIALANYAFDGASTLTNNAMTNQTGQITIGDQTGINATLTNSSSGTYKLAGDFNINGGAASAKFVNAGLFDRTEGSATAFIGVNFASTGTVENDHALLQFNGPANTIGGKVTGAGEIGFGSTSVTQFSAGTVTASALGLFDNATLNIKANVSYDGNLDNHSGGTTTLNIGTSTFALGADSVSEMTGFAGNAVLTGKGAFTNAGELTLSNMIVGGAVTVSNSGTILQTGTVTAGDGSGRVPVLGNTKTGVYNFASDAALNENNAAVSFVNKGILEKTAGTGTSDVHVNVNNSGTVQVATGAMSFDGALDNSGTIRGLGAVVINGTATLETSSVVSVATLDVFNTGSLTIKGALTYAGVFDDAANGGDNLTLATTASKLTLTGASNSFSGAFGSANIDGAGILVNQGTLSMSNTVFNNTVSFQNDGTVNQTGAVQIGGGDGHTASIVNETGKVWNFTGTQSLNVGTATTSHFDNHGTVNVNAGSGQSAAINVHLNNDAGATIDIVTGALDIGNVFVNAGTIKGTDLVLTTGPGNSVSQTTLNDGTVLSVGEIDILGTSALAITANMSYSGIFHDQAFGGNSFNIENKNFTLLGASDFNSSFGSDVITGSGTFKIAADSKFDFGTILIGGTAKLDLAGNVTVGANLQIGDSSASTASAILESGKTYDLVNDSGVGHGTSDASVFTNNGTFEKTAGTGTSIVSADFVNNGTITVTSGTLEFLAGTLSGSGAIHGNKTTDSNGNIFITAASPPHAPQPDAFVFPDHAATAPHDYAVTTLHGQDLDTLLAHIAHDALV